MPSLPSQTISTDKADGKRQRSRTLVLVNKVHTVTDLVKFLSTSYTVKKAGYR